MCSTEEDIVEFLDATIAITKKIIREYTEQVDVFKAQINELRTTTHNVEPLGNRICHFIQYSFWTYLKFKRGIYHANDPMIASAEGKSVVFARLEKEELDEYLRKHNILPYLSNPFRNHGRLRYTESCYTFVYDKFIQNKVCKK